MKEDARLFISKYSPMICFSAFKFMFDMDEDKIVDLSFDNEEIKKDKSEIGTDFYYKNFDKLKQELYCFYVLLSFRDDRLGTEDGLKKAGATEYIIKQYEKNCKEKIKNLKYVHYNSYYSTSEKKYYIKRYSVDDLLNRKEQLNNEDSKKRLESLRKLFDIEQIFDSNSANELSYYCKNKTLIVALDNIINVRSYNEANGLKLSDEKIKNYLDNRPKNIEAPASNAIVRETILPVLNNKPEEFDLDKILLLYALKIKNKLESTEWTKENEDENIRLANLLKCCKNEIKKKIRYTVDGNVVYSNTDLDKDIDRIAQDGYYISQNEEKQIKSSIDILKSQKDERLSVIKLNIDDIKNLATTPENISFIMSKKLLTIATLKNAVKEGAISQKNIAWLYNNGILYIQDIDNYVKDVDLIEADILNLLTGKRVKEFYLDGKSNNENIENLSSKMKNDISQLLTVEELYDYYSIYNQTTQDDSKNDMFDKYAFLFKTTIINETNASKIGEKIIDFFIDNDAFEKDDIKKLYEEKLITIDNIFQICETNDVADLLVEGMFSNEDIKKICIEKEQFEIMYNILHRDDISWENKVALYRISVSNIDINKFSDDKKEIIKEYQKSCEKILNFSKIQQPSHNTIIKPNPSPNPNVKSWNHYASNPQLRWDLFDSLGKYNYKFLKNGVVVFKYEDLNLKKSQGNNPKTGPIIIESIFGKGGQPAYGKSTIIVNMDINTFEQYETELTRDGDIFVNISNHPNFQGKFDKISHTSKWGNRIADTLGFNSSSCRSEEDLEKIDEIIKSVEKSREVFKPAK